MTLPLSELLSIAGVLVGVIVAVTIGLTYVFSRVRRASDALREEYIRGLERDRVELRADNADLLKRNADLRAELSELRGQVRVLQDLVLNGHCRRFLKDAVTGGCTHCELGMPPLQRRIEDDRG
jgi:cell division protein FtsB